MTRREIEKGGGGEGRRSWRRVREQAWPPPPSPRWRDERTRRCVSRPPTLAVFYLSLSSFLTPSLPLSRSRGLFLYGSSITIALERKGEKARDSHTVRRDDIHYRVYIVSVSFSSLRAFTALAKRFAVSPYSPLAWVYTSLHVLLTLFPFTVHFHLLFLSLSLYAYFLSFYDISSLSFFSIPHPYHDFLYPHNHSSQRYSYFMHFQLVSFAASHNILFLCSPSQSFFLSLSVYLDMISLEWYRHNILQFVRGLTSRRKLQSAHSSLIKYNPVRNQWLINSLIAEIPHFRVNIISSQRTIFHSLQF